MTQLYGHQWKYRWVKMPCTLFRPAEDIILNVILTRKKVHILQLKSLLCMMLKGRCNDADF